MKINIILIYIYYYFINNKIIDNLNFIINDDINSYSNKNYIIFLKYSHIFIYLLIKLLKLNLIKLFKFNKYFEEFNKSKINNFFLKYKDNKLLIYLETFNNYLLINNYKFNYFYKNRNIKIFLYKNFIFKIEVIIYLIYKDYIDWIKRYKYNEYLDENLKLFKYPLLKILLREVDKDNLYLAKKNEEKNANNLYVINNYNLYNINIEKRKKNYMQFVNKKYWYFSKKKGNIIKLLLLLLKSKMIYKNNFNNFIELKNNIFLYYFWFRKIKHFEITTAYNYKLLGYDWSRSEKLKSETIYDFYWQMNRYGFLLYYYNPLTLNYLAFNLIKNKILNMFNILFLIKYLKKNRMNAKIVNLFWYKIIRIVVIDYIRKYLFIFFFFHKLEIIYKLYKHNWVKIIKKFNIKYIENSLSFQYIYRMFIDLTNLLNFIIYPLNIEIYNNSKNISSFIEINKNNFNRNFWFVFYFNNNDYLNNYYLDTKLIFNKIFIDLNINIMYNNIINILYKFIWKYNIEYVYINNYNYIIFIKDLIMKLFQKIKKHSNIHLKSQNIEFLCFFKTYTGIDLWYNFYRNYITNWYWTYDFWLIYYVLRLYILDLYFMLICIIII